MSPAAPASPPSRPGLPSAAASPRDRLVWVIALLWIIAVAPLLPWGLPDRGRDELLFGGGPAWTAERFQAVAALAARDARGGGADTDLDPLPPSSSIVNLTAREADRAQVLRRYRLYSRQPDEMITFMALQRMRPGAGDFDPRLYQYGGAWIYGVGAALGLAEVLGIADVRSDAGFYLEQPEQFARFYVVARWLSLMASGLLLVAVARIGALLGGRSAGWLAAAALCVCPVFLTMSLEAKPHMASACLLAWAVLAGLRFADTGGRSAALAMGAAAGGAFAFVLTGVVAVALWPVLFWERLRSHAALRPTLLSLASGGALVLIIYAVSNPYLILNSLFHVKHVSANLGNSTAMYTIGLDRFAPGAVRVGELLLECCGTGVLIVGTLGTGLLLARRTRTALLLLAPAAAMLLVGIALGADKPGEYGRFLLIPTVFLAIAAGWGATRIRGAGGLLTAALLLVLSGARAWDYAAAFAADAHGNETRLAAAAGIEQRIPRGVPIGVFQEPAPYAVPPIDFAHREIRLLPRTANPDALHTLIPDLPEWLVLTADTPNTHAQAWWRPFYQPFVSFGPDTPPVITWANKPVYIYRRTDR